MTNSGLTIDGVIRDLAARINANAEEPYTPAQLVKATITAFDNVGPPPTVSIVLSADPSAVAIDGVRFLESYSPTVGDVVAIAKQGSDILILGAYSNAVSNWTTATLSSGYTHDGDSQGNVQYRLVWDNGSLKMEWQGAAARSANVTIINALSSSFRPSSKRKVPASIGYGGGQSTAQLVFNTSGTVVYDAVSVTAFPGTGSGTTVTTPTDWISFNGISYFL